MANYQNQLIMILKKLQRLFGKEESRESLKFNPLPDDVYLVSYPKSGNTWVRFILGNYMTSGKMDFSNGHLLMPDIHFNPEQIQHVPFSPRFIKSHFPYRPEYRNVVYIVRDGRDAAVSLYYFMIKMKQLDKETSFSTFLKDHFFVGNVPFGDWAEHILSWVNKKDSANILIVKYEDLLSDSQMELQKILRFLKMEIDEEKLNIATQKASFDSMKKSEIEHSAELKKLGHDSSEGTTGIVREGKKSSWKTMFSPQEEKQFNELYGKTMELLGYKL
jgi:hypothetical protein